MPVPRGEEVEHYVHLWKHKIPMDNGRKIASRKQAVAIGLSLARKRESEKARKRMARSKKKKRRRQRKKNPSWLTSPDPMLGLPNWIVALGVVAAGFAWFTYATAQDAKQQGQDFKKLGL